MEPAALSTFLAGLPHFRGLDPDLLAAVAATGTVRELSAGDEVFREGQRCDGLFAVESGSVKIYRLREDGGERIVHRVGPGRSFAEAALFHGGRFPARAAALETPTRVVRLQREGFLALFEGEPRLAASMVGSLSTWLHTLVEHIETLSIASAGARLAHHLMRLPAVDEAGVLVVTLPMPKKDVAAMLSITPETLSRLLARWKARGVVAVDGARVELRDVTALETLADSGG